MLNDANNTNATNETNDILFGILWMIMGFIIIITAIYLPDINSCDGWCCSSAKASAKANGGDQKNMSSFPFQPQDSKISLNQYTREQSGKESGSNTAVLVMENFFTGLATLNVPHQPIYNLAKLAAEVRPEKTPNDTDKPIYTYLHKNKFPLVAISGKKGTAQEIYMAAYMAQALVREQNGVLVINGMTADSPALEAWNKLIENEIIHCKVEDVYHNDNEDWAKGTFTEILLTKSVSEYLCEILSEYLSLTEDSKTQYYIISKEREDELRKAYKTDKKFTVNNVTSAFHAAVLKVLYPTINITIDSAATDASDSPNAELYAKATEFLEKYILV